MLLWWDSTLAIITRQGMKFHKSYLEHLIEHEKSDGWSFYQLTGCPTQLFIHLVRLTEMARQKEVAEKMELLDFNMAAVFELEEEILNWRNTYASETGSPQITEEPEALSAEDTSFQASEQAEKDEEDAYVRLRDDYHCMEAWRFSLLMYIQRVFRWNRAQHRKPAELLSLTYKVLDHSRNCRKTSLVQKQLLLPMFLVGAEARDGTTRDIVLSYCRWWGAKTHYGMFFSVASLLQDFWNQQDLSKPSPLWWGSYLDSKSGYVQNGQFSSVQYLFG